jgi:hypothetical protein
MNSIIRQESAVTVLGVPAQAFSVVADESRLLNQTIKASRKVSDYETLTAELRFDDQCKNGHASFAITGTLRDSRSVIACGCLHEDIKKAFPEFAPLIKWHLVGTDGPMHYIANTLYWLGYSGWCDDEYNSPPNLQYARNTAVWNDLPESMVCPTEIRDLKSTREEAAKLVRSMLEERLPQLLNDFKAAMLEVGFIYA